MLKNQKNWFKLLLFVSCSLMLNASVPLVPGNYIGVTDINETSVRVNFLDNSNDENGFLLLLNEEETLLNIPQNDETQHSYQYATLTDLTCDKIYSISVLAYNNEGNSTYTDTRTFSIKSTFDFPCTENKAPIVDFETTTIILPAKSYSNISVKAEDLDGEIVDCEWRVNGDIISRYCNQWIPNYYELIYPFFETGKTVTLSVTMTDDDGAIGRDKVIVKRESADSEIHISIDKEANQTMFVGQTLIINSSIRAINWKEGPFQSYGWYASSGIFTSLGYRGHPGGFKNTSTLYRATEEGKNILTLSATAYNGASNSKEIVVNVVPRSHTRDNLKQVVVDNVSGLMWEDNSMDILKSWNSEENYLIGLYLSTEGDTATTYCNELVWGDYSDWRLPNLEEITGYIEPDDAKEYWSSSVPLEQTSVAWSSKALKTTKEQKLLVKCVRN